MFIYGVFIPKSIFKDALAVRWQDLRCKEFEISQECIFKASNERTFYVSRSFHCGRKLIESN
jgi:hypothetical protein